VAGCTSGPLRCPAVRLLRRATPHGCTGSQPFSISVTQSLCATPPPPPALMPPARADLGLGRLVHGHCERLLRAPDDTSADSYSWSYETIGSGHT